LTASIVNSLQCNHRPSVDLRLRYLLANTPDARLGNQIKSALQLSNKRRFVDIPGSLGRYNVTDPLTIFVTTYVSLLVVCFGCAG